MRLLSLNLWGGQRDRVLFDYLQNQAKVTDIFCFQEVFRSAFEQNPEGFSGRVNLFSELSELLPDHIGYFEKTSQNHDTIKIVDYPVDGGQAIFIKKTLNVTVQDAEKIYEGMGRQINPSSENLPTALQRVELNINGKVLQIYNYHGIAYPGDKLDTPQRIECSKKIIKITKEDKGAKILCGDFNLMPETESIKMLGAEMKDLIQDYKITNTRNEISWKQYHNIQHFADFTFTSSEIKVLIFEVPYNLASDHLPMILDFEF
jgi:endonuclease/exonuclease/phosphatase family metal-dependent hydrolase